MTQNRSKSALDSESYYTVNNIACCLNLVNRTVNQMIFCLQLDAIFTVGHNGERYFSIYQMEIIKLQLENKARAFKLDIDFEHGTVNVVYKSKINFEL